MRFLGAPASCIGSALLCCALLIEFQHALTHHQHALAVEGNFGKLSCVCVCVCEKKGWGGGERGNEPLGRLKKKKEKEKCVLTAPPPSPPPFFLPLLY